MSRNEEILTAIANGTAIPDFEPQSRNEALLMQIGCKNDESGQSIERDTPLIIPENTLHNTIAYAKVDIADNTKTLKVYKNNLFVFDSYKKSTQYGLTFECVNGRVHVTGSNTYGSAIYLTLSSIGMTSLSTNLHNKLKGHRVRFKLWELDNTTFPSAIQIYTRIRTSTTGGTGAILNGSTNKEINGFITGVDTNDIYMKMMIPANVQNVDFTFSLTEEILFDLDTKLTEYENGTRNNYQLTSEFSAVDLQNTKNTWLVYGVADSFTIQINYQKSKITPLSFKKIACLGDSICYGSGFKPAGWNDGGYAYLILKDNPLCEIINYGKGGATLADSANMIKTQATNLMSYDFKPDIVLLEGGTNDFYNNVAAGNISAGFNAELTLTTVSGGLENIIKILQTNLTKVVFVEVHAMGQAAIHTKVKEICAKWHIPIANMYDDSGLNIAISDVNNAYMLANETGNGDCTHPNKKGYEVFYMPIIYATI